MVAICMCTNHAFIGIQTPKDQTQTELLNNKQSKNTIPGDQKHKCMLKSARKAGEARYFACVLSNARSGKRVKDRRPAQGGGYRTAALFRAAVTRPPPCRAAVSSLKAKRLRKGRKKGKTKHAVAEQGMRDVNACP